MIPELHSVLQLLDTGFAQLKILVVGDIMLDRYIVGEVDRISPEAPVPVLRHAQRYERPGGAANVAMNLAGLGCQTFLCGFWGADSEQTELARLLAAANVDTVACVSSSLATISKTRIVALRQQLLRLDIESRSPAPAEESTRLEARALDLVSNVNAVILSDYAKGVLTPDICAAIIRAARTAGIPILVDPKSRDLSKYSGATTVCPNLAELSLATNVPAADTDRLLTAARVQMQEHDIRFLTVTMSEKGIRILGPGPGLDDDYLSPARAREVFDVSGAGDTVIATLAAALAGKLHIHTAVELANLAAGVVVGKTGTVPISAHELIAELTPAAGAISGAEILDLDQLERRIADLRASGQTTISAADLLAELAPKPGAP